MQRYQVGLVVAVMVCGVIGLRSQVESAGGAQQHGSQEVEAGDNLRNQLLRQLQGLTPAERVQRAVEIATEATDLFARRDALQYLLGMNADLQPVIPTLVDRLLLESDPTTVGLLQQILAQHSTLSEATLLGAAAAVNQTQLQRIIVTLGQAESIGPESIELFRTHLDSADMETTLAVCQSLERQGQVAQELLPDLIAIAGRPRAPLEVDGKNSRHFRHSRNKTRAVVRAMAAVGVDMRALAVLSNALSMEASIAEPAAQALGTLGADAASALPLLKQLRDRDDHGGKDIKTRTAKIAAEKAIKAIERSTAEQ
jgi:hypothetical protein